ncbi:MAG: phage tail spike protein [Alkaliphilus sp.]
MYNTGKHYNTGVQFNALATPWKPPGWYTQLGHALPIVLDAYLQPTALLHQAYKIFIHDTLAGESKLLFSIPVPESGFVDRAPGSLIDLAGKIYRATIIADLEGAAGTRVAEVEAWALWYDLVKMPDLPAHEWLNASISDVLTWLLSGSGWAAGTITATGLRNLKWDGGVNRLECLREMERVFNAEIVWDTVLKTISVAPGGGTDTGLFFLREKNLRKAESETDIVDMVHRLYPRGHQGLTISIVNNGIPYLEVSSPFDPPPSALLIAEEFTDPHQLKEYAAAVFATMNTPRINYECEIADLSAIPGYETEQIQLGDVVTVFDEHAGINIKSRVVRMRYNVEEPWNSLIELSTVRQDLSHALSQVVRTFEQFEAVEGVRQSDIRQLMVFNHLLNSRGDDGFAYWVNSGWVIDTTKGFSSTNSFQAEGALGVSKTLTQSVWPAHRENYVVSLRALLENVLLGPAGKVGVEVIVHYTDATSETHFISLV